MGYYIPNNIPVLQRPNTYQINEPTSLKDVRPDEAIICEVDNGPFKANAFAYSEGELQVFQRPDGQFKVVGIKSRSYKRPVIIENLAGKRYVTSPSTLLRQLNA